ncbi:TetR/AcrR family transcriptional regulator [Streptomyces sp. G-G2]|uniref:TetR/AcrR family transcriptional regulator n=1 Tax=Streptomyces sp. G-G2 TaxID=3046201 RepID=UPI0024BA9480|nr:TetR/AcrR family transcriptional regulator [Streptomyces sp. G-G2]MDJ0381999.1 TetR/AcrR family transcriptional regulator [Streptomyces sp. G-G2]
MQQERPDPTGSNRDRIIAAATRLLVDGGREALSTRAVSAAAGLQAPTIYRVFGDKQGLLDAVAAHGFAAHLAAKTDVRPTSDPVEDLRTGWTLNIGFALANPALYCLMYGDPRPGGPSAAAVAAFEHLTAYVHRIAEAGRLRVTEERAARLVHAAGSGTALALIALPEPERDLTVSDMAREAVISAVTTESAAPTDPGPASAAVALRAVLPRTPLSVGERGLLKEWLDRIAD